MFKKGEIVQSMNSASVYECQSDELNSKVYCKCIIASTSNQQLGDFFTIDAKRLQYYNHTIPAPTLMNFKAGDKVYLKTPAKPTSGKYGWSFAMEGMLNSGKVYTIDLVYSDYYTLLGNPYMWLPDYLELIPQYSVAISNEANSASNEEADPFGLIAQRKALREFIGE